MSFQLHFTEKARTSLEAPTSNPSQQKRFKAVRKTLGQLEKSPRYPGLNTHKYSALKGPNGEDVFEAYAENNTPAAYRIFWCYGPKKGSITIISISPHP